MNRGDLSWALSACLPHAQGDVVIEGAYVFATDTYTTGLARVDAPLLAQTVWLPVKEARDLERFVRPSRKAHNEETVRALVDDHELHVGIEDDTAVFNLQPFGYSLENILVLLSGLYALPDDRRELIFQPSFAARFAKAQRQDTDVLRVYARLSGRPVERGIALVSVGTDFVGAVAGLAHDDAPRVLEDFLQNTTNTRSERVA